MKNQDYLHAAEQALHAIEVCCDKMNETTDADIDNIRNGNALVLNFPNDTQIIINLQKPIQEIWLAARAGGYHFTLRENGLWCENREGLELFSALSAFATQQSGMEMRFTSL